MRTILFFDDWPIQGYWGIDRVWPRAEPWPGCEPWYDSLLSYSSVNTVLRDADTGIWHMWGTGTTTRDKGDEGAGLYYYTSTDGLAWQPALQNPPVDAKATSAASHLVFSGEYSAGGGVFRDIRETDASRRFKLPYSDLSPRPVAAEGTCRVATSPDGIHWTIDKRAVWRMQHTDTHPGITYNPYTNKYQFTHRPILGDRRVALYQTNDWVIFEKPLVVVHPDPSDPPCVEFYGMPHFFYEGYFVGFLWRQHGALIDTTIPSRMKGRVDSELTYSINGIQWNRTTRQAFLPDTGTTMSLYRNEYPIAMALDEQGWLRIYTNSCVGEHNDGKKFAADENICYVTTSRLRRDGFCALESHSDVGQVLLRPLIARGGPIKINATTARFGRIRAELRMVPDNKPIPGYELENSIPIVGDGHFLTLRWKEKESVDQFAGQPFRLFLEMEQARLYAVRVDADLLYGWVPEINLAGDYIPEQLPGLTPGQDAAYVGNASTP